MGTIGTLSKKSATKDAVILYFVYYVNSPNRNKVYCDTNYVQGLRTVQNIGRAAY